GGPCFYERISGSLSVREREDNMTGSPRFVPNSLTGWTALFTGLALIVPACGGGSGSQSPAAPTPEPTPSVSITAITVTGSSPRIGQTSQFSAVASLSDGTTRSVTSVATWQSSNPAV